MAVIENWRVVDPKDFKGKTYGPMPKCVVVAWMPESEKLFAFKTDTPPSWGKGIRRHKALFQEYVFFVTEVREDEGLGFSLGGWVATAKDPKKEHITLVMPFETRAKNKNYDVQTREELDKFFL